MTGVEFNEHSSFERVRTEDTPEKGMVGWLIKKGLASNAEVGNYILIGVAVFFFLMSALMFYIL